MATVTALGPERRGCVAVELDGEPWRSLPADVVARTLLRIGAELDRARLRELRRELRRHEALGAAARALRHRDHSHAGLDERLRRAGIREAERAAALVALERAGYVDDRAFAERRARQLAAKDWGDAAIAADLERQGLDAAAREEALAVLPPERDRALAVAERRGHGPRTVGYLARRGFGDDALEPFVARDA